jgi:hypothetical protein
MTERAKRVFWIVFLVACLLLGLVLCLHPEQLSTSGAFDSPMVDPPIGGR